MAARRFGYRATYLKKTRLSVSHAVLRGHPAWPYYDEMEIIGRFPAVIAPGTRRTVIGIVEAHLSSGRRTSQEAMTPIRSSTASVSSFPHGGDFRH